MSHAPYLIAAYNHLGNLALTLLALLRCSRHGFRRDDA